MHQSSSHHYLLAGLRLRSEIELPELLTADRQADVPDVEIELGELPRRLQRAQRVDPWTEISGQRVLVQIEGIARYLIQGGRQIRIEPEPGVKPRDLRLFLLGSAFGALYFQRGDFPLHASACVVRGEALAFAGDSGCGKSTLAACMHARGYPLACDDVLILRFDAAGRPLAYPAFPRLKLWRDTLTELSIPTAKLQRDYLRSDKFHLPVSRNFATGPVPLRHVFMLGYGPHGLSPTIEEIRPAQAAPLLRDATYRPQYVSGLGLTADHFRQCVQIARFARLYRLTRPQALSRLDECLERVLEVVG